MVVTKLFRSSKQNRTALEKLRHIRDLINTCAYYLGFDILRSDFVIKSKKTLFFVTAVLSLIACEFYTIYFYMGNISKQLQSICVVMYSCIGVIKIRLVVTRHVDIFKTYLWLESNFLVNQTGRRQKLLDKNIEKTIFIMKSTFIAVVFATCFYGVYPMYVLVFKGKRELFINVVLPGVDHESIAGFYVTSFYLMVISGLGVAAVMAFDMFMLLIICGYTSFNVLLEDSVKSLNLMLLKNKHSLKYRHLYMRNILIAFQDTERYIVQINDLFGSIIFYQVALMSISMIVTLFCVVVNNWSGGIGFFGFTLTFFLSICYSGTVVQTANEKLVEIVNEIDWYLLPVQDQKMVLMLIRKTQSCTEMWIGWIAPLNVESGLEVLKIIYNSFMMMLEFLNK